MEKQDVDEKHKQCVRLQVQGKKNPRGGKAEMVKFNRRHRERSLIF